MSDVNKLDDKQCSFDPEQYKVTYKTTVELSNDVTAPIGSFAWAIIQLNLGNLVNRKDWSSPKQYLRLNEGLGYIEEHDKHDQWACWSPKQEDMVACDWNLLKSNNCMLEFYLMLGTGKSHDTLQYSRWGYMSGQGGFGSLTGLQTSTAIGNVSGFYFSDFNRDIYLFVHAKQNRYQDVMTLLKRNLYVTVDGVNYNLGSTTPSGSRVTNTCVVDYLNNTAEELGEVFQKTGQTKHFCLSWK
ncbi:Thoeris anti-defense Tad2 family protein [Xenorhabdus bharatensis]|uniref:Thoeris anti-defense Tad2 family protein n=1 Tax=Xenorhabdus bharatensis TaxID=3136256 RepID=UPI0030F4584A